MSSFPGSPLIPGPALPGVYITRTATYRRVTMGDEQYFPGGIVIDGANANDDQASPYVYELYAGHLLGLITGTNTYGSSIIGLSTHALATTDTTLKTSAAIATEIVRRIGSSGTLNLTAPPTAAGTVATTAVTFSAVNTTTGDVTITATGVACVTGALIQPNDGSQTPRTFIGNGYPFRVANYDLTRLSAPLAQAPIRAVVIAGNLINWPADTSLQAWIESKLNSYGQFVFRESYQP